MYIVYDEWMGGMCVQLSFEDYFVWEDCIIINGFLLVGKINLLFRKYVKKVVKILNFYIKEGCVDKLLKNLSSILVEKGLVI